MAQHNSLKGNVYHKLTSKIQKDCDFTVDNDVAKGPDGWKMIFIVSVYGKKNYSHIKVNSGWEKSLKDAVKKARLKFHAHQQRDRKAMRKIRKKK